MGFDTIPAIPADYPLYDWADWQSSRDALAPGVKTKQFQIAAWNAIVDSLANAINAAGQEWDTSYTTAAGAKITALDPKLYARKYNSIRLNIDRQMHLEWPWAEDSAFRGYVGREDFLGREDVGKDCDKVYPEYILELVRKLNLLLDIMRGGDLIRYADTQHISGTLIELSMYSGAGDHIQYSHNTQVLCISSAFTGRGSGISGNAMSACIQSADANTGIGSQFRFSSISQVLVRADGQSKPSNPFDLSQVALQSNISAQALSVKPLLLDAAHISGSSTQADTYAKRAIQLIPEGTVVRSSMTVEFQHGKPSHGSGTLLISGPVVSVSMDKRKPKRLGCSSRSGTASTCTVENGWQPPKWVNGGLWIRQVHDNPIQRENGELEVT